MKAGSYRENQLASERVKLSAHSGADVVIAIRAPRALGTSAEFDKWLNADEEDIDTRNGENTTRVALLTSKNPRSRHSMQNIYNDAKAEEVQLRRRSDSFRRLSSEQVLKRLASYPNSMPAYCFRQCVSVMIGKVFELFEPEELQTIFPSRLVLLYSLRFCEHSAWTQSRSGTQHTRWRIVSDRPPTPGALPAQGRPERYGL